MRGPDPQPAACQEVPAFAVPSAAYSSPTATRSFFLSVCLHLLVVSGLVSLDSLPGRQGPRPPTVDELIADDGHRLTWYVNKADELPAVSPPEPAPQSAGESGSPRFRMPQRIAANDPEAESGRQVIWEAVPEIELPQDVPSQNLLAWSPPEVTMPRYQMEARTANAPSAQALDPAAAPNVQPNQLEVNLAELQDLPKLRYQAAQEQAQAPPERTTLAAVSPDIAAATTSGPDLEKIQPLAPIRYWTSEQPQAQPAQRALSEEAAPQVQIGAVSRLDVPGTELPRLRYWAEQRQGAAPSQQAIGAEEAPVVAAASPAGGAASLAAAQSLPRLRYWRPEGGQPTAPAGTALASVAASAGQPSALASGGGPAGPGGPGTELVQAQSLALLSRVTAPSGSPGTGGGSAQPSRAVVGIDADRDATATDIRGSRKGRFTAGPQGGQGEGTGEKGSGTGSGLEGKGSGSQGADPGNGVTGSGTLAQVRIPNLSIGGAPAAAAAVTALSRPDAKDVGGDREALLRRIRDVRLETPPALPGQLPEPPPNLEMPLSGKAVFSLAVNMPNVSSYSGSWIIEFAELNENKQPGALAPPSPRYKVDPKYVRSAIEEEIEGEVVLHAVIRRDGQVDQIRVMKGLDDRLDDSAMAALSKWRFNPATKAGLPIDIETVVRIPFRLAPADETAR